MHKLETWTTVVLRHLIFMVTKTIQQKLTKTKTKMILISKT